MDETQIKCYDTMFSLEVQKVVLLLDWDFDEVGYANQKVIDKFRMKC